MRKMIGLLSILMVLTVIIIFINKESYKTKSEHKCDSIEKAIEILSDHEYPLPQTRNEFVYTIVDIEEERLVINDHTSSTNKIELVKGISDDFYILLHENSTIAYHWILDDLEGDTIELLNNTIVEIPYKGDRDGENNNRRLFHFRANKDGTNEMVFTYQYYDNSRSDDFEDEITFNLTIVEE